MNLIIIILLFWLLFLVPSISKDLPKSNTQIQWNLEHAFITLEILLSKVCRSDSRLSRNETHIWLLHFFVVKKWPSLKYCIISSRSLLILCVIIWSFTVLLMKLFVITRSSESNLVSDLQMFRISERIFLQKLFTLFGAIEMLWWFHFFQHFFRSQRCFLCRLHSYLNCQLSRIYTPNQSTHTPDL